MEIPQELQEFLRLENLEERLNVANALVGPDQKGTLIGLAALAEEGISQFLARVLADPDRVTDVYELVTENLSFAKKTDALRESLARLGALKSDYENHLVFLTALRRLRNQAAHSFGITLDRAQELGADREIVFLARDFPKNVQQRIRELDAYLAGVQSKK